MLNAQKQKLLVFWLNKLFKTHEKPQKLISYIFKNKQNPKTKATNWKDEKTSWRVDIEIKNNLKSINSFRCPKCTLTSYFSRKPCHCIQKIRWSCNVQRQLIESGRKRCAEHVNENCIKTHIYGDCCHQWNMLIILSHIDKSKRKMFKEYVNNEIISIVTNSWSCITQHKCLYVAQNNKNMNNNAIEP